ncbi:MAG TPA: DUF5335 family protein [Solirubrobacteraceae bacterium]|nr:DUF5335 family protein [Solirubrobacteraceae bacterium]
MKALRELARETWSQYFDALSKELLHAPVSIEIEGPDEPMVAVSRMALLALAYDRRGDVFEVSAARGGPHTPSVLRHLIDRPARVSVDSQTILAPRMIAVDGSDNVRTIIRIAAEGAISG